MGKRACGCEPVRNLTIRSTWFDNRVKNPVSNVTRTRSCEYAAAAESWPHAHLGSAERRRVPRAPSWRATAGYVYNQATVREFAANPAIVGKFLPQVPEHRGSVQLAYANARWLTAALGIQYVGRQFDDDANARAVPGESDTRVAGLRAGGFHRVARAGAQLRRLPRSTERVRPGIHRRHAADDHRIAAARARRCARPYRGALTLLIRARRGPLDPRTGPDAKPRDDVRRRR